MMPKDAAALSAEVRDKMITEIVCPQECDAWKPFNAYAMIKKEDCGHHRCRPVGQITRYSSSLEAMHQAEECFSWLPVLKHNQWWMRYCGHLDVLLGLPHLPQFGAREYKAHVHATAEQRAIAFLSTVFEE